MTRIERTLPPLFMHVVESLRRRADTSTAGNDADEPQPLRAALFSSDQMVAYGKELAQHHRLAKNAAPDRLLARLASNERVLERSVQRMRDAVSADHAVTPGAEWLLDNKYLIDEEIRTARRHLPRGYSHKLPRLAESGGQPEGTPRIYDLALQSVAHADGRLTGETLSRFVAAYQVVQPLQLGELWAFPIMLRLALIENLRRVSVQVAQSLEDRRLADTWAAAMLQAADERPSDLILVIADMARAGLPLRSSAFVAEFARRL
ncbi:MAG TPA: hypothetical protein VH328_01250, partial [Burkholderiaceae bacterium]|nr:hypothetical protein [Burkholderiaceae bacterium]